MEFLEIFTYKYLHMDGEHTREFSKIFTQRTRTQTLRRRWWYSRRTADYITSQKIKTHIYIYFSRIFRLRGDMFTIWILSSFLLQFFFVVLFYCFCLLLFVLKMKNTFIHKFISLTHSNNSSVFLSFIWSELYMFVFLIVSHRPAKPLKALDRTPFSHSQTQMNGLKSSPLGLIISLLCCKLLVYVLGVSDAAEYML